jgi:hypothetical protein
MPEQRAHPRYAIELDAVLELDPDRKVHGRTQDISRGGFCLLAAAETAPVAAGSHCKIRLALVFSENEFSEQLELRGSVAWCTRLKAGVQVGVKFDPLDAQSRGYLDLFIKFLEEGRAAAEPEAELEPEEDED